ncbi:MAG: hypothetical protein M3Q58_02095, partial [Bacteroidota bacterium]|nr:hypothetical protein [Bacteroidota bacterium]
VTAFQHKGISESDWEQMFAHYLNITLSKRLVDIILDINNELKAIQNPNEILIDINIELEIIFPDQPNITSFLELEKVLRKEEVKLISFLNNVSTHTKPQLIPNGYLLNLIAKSIQKQDCFKGKSIHVFVDEYENLLLYQQKIINTLIKHPSPTIFDVGTRKEGLKTHQTLSETEIITPPHDFNRFDFETFSETDYERLLLDVCSKRLISVFNEFEIKPETKFTDIRYYLGSYSLSEEVNKIDNNIVREGYIESIQKIIWGSNWKEERIKDNKFKPLYHNNDLLILRLNLCLLERGENPDLLTKELAKYSKEQQSKYVDWVHNNKNGLIYLMVKEIRGSEKEYYGFNTYKSLSSGIIRYFLELCESAFKQANRKGFNFNSPRVISAEEQTKAAYYVSSYKINDIDTFTPYGNRLKLFTLIMGKIFDKLHRDRKSSEPERNHFGTEFEKLSDDSKKFLQSALLYSVFQKTDETKDKSSAIDSNSFEFHLNHIYSPYFQISPRRIRKLIIPYKSLEILINKDVTEAESEANKISKVKTGSSDHLLQIRLFDDL